MALCRILSQGEEDRARAYVKAAGYDVLPGCIPERTAYREAHNRGQAVTETKKSLNERVDMLMEGLDARVAQQLSAHKKHRARKAKECVMSRDDDVGKMLGSWLGKAKKIGQPPQPGEAKETLKSAGDSARLK